MIDFLMDLGANLARFWEGFGGQVGTKLGPNATKTEPKKQSKNYYFLGAFRNDLGWILAPKSQNPPKIVPEGFQKVIIFVIVF